GSSSSARRSRGEAEMSVLLVRTVAAVAGETHASAAMSARVGLDRGSGVSSVVRTGTLLLLPEETIANSIAMFRRLLVPGCVTVPHLIAVNRRSGLDRGGWRS